MTKKTKQEDDSIPTQEIFTVSGGRVLIEKLLITEISYIAICFIR